MSCGIADAFREVAKTQTAHIAALERLREVVPPEGARVRLQSMCLYHKGQDGRWQRVSYEVVEGKYCGHQPVRLSDSGVLAEAVQVQDQKGEMFLAPLTGIDAFHRI